MTTADRLVALAVDTPGLTMAEAGRIVGVSRERVRQLTHELELPFGMGWRRRRVLVLHDSGLHHSTIALQEGMSNSWTLKVIRDSGRNILSSKLCEWCGESYETVFRDRQRWCSPRCKHNGRRKIWLLKVYGNLPCVRCGIRWAEATENPCPGHKRHRFRHNDSLTHCRRGHEWTPENTYQYRTRRACRSCARQRYRDRKKP